MTLGEKREILKDYKRIDGRIDWLCNELERWRSIAQKVTSSADVLSAGPVGGRLENAVEKIIEIEHELDRSIDALVDLRSKIERAVTKLNDTAQRDIISIRYIEGQTDWDIISGKVGYSKRQTIRLHKSALKNIEFN